MIKFIKKYRVTIVIGVVLVLFGLNFYLYKDSKNLTEIKSQLELENFKLNLDIQKSQVKEKLLLKDIKNKTGDITKLDTQLTHVTTGYRQLQEQMTTMPKPENPGLFKELNECQQKYTALVTSLNLCLAANEKGDQSLNLCLDKSQKQKELFTLQEMAYVECQQQGQLMTQKLNDTADAMERLDRYYKRKILKKNTIKYTVGIILGIAAGYFMFKKK